MYYHNMASNSTSIILAKLLIKFYMCKFNINTYNIALNKIEKYLDNESP